MSPDPAKPYAGGRDRASVTRMLQFVDNLVWKGLTAAWSGDLSRVVKKLGRAVGTSLVWSESTAAGHVVPGSSDLLRLIEDVANS